MPYRMSPGRTRYFFARSSGPRHLHRLTPPFAPRRAADLKDRAGQSDWAGPFELNRFRATSAAAAAPKSRIMGGAGTGVPPVELLLVVPPLLLELELEEVEVELPVDEDVEELELPKLEVPPELLEAELDEDEVLEEEDVTPLLVLVELPPVLVEPDRK